MSAKQDRNLRAYGTAEWIFREGDPPGFAYIVETGRVEILREGRDGLYRIETAGPGEMFGELALIDDAPRGAGARTLEPAILITVDAAVFQRKLRETDPVVRRIMRILIQRLREQTDARISGKATRRIEP